MSKLGICLLGLTATAGVVVSLALRHHATARQHENEQQFQRQERQLAELAAANQRLSNLVAQPTSPLSAASEQMGELQRLRHEAEALRKQTGELATQREQNRKSPAPASASGQDSPPSQEYEQMRGARAVDGLHLVTACLRYAWEHENQVPSNFDQVTNYLQEDHLSLTGTNLFEFVYQGSLTELTNIPLGDVALIRGQAWRTPDGRMMRVYGMAGGFSQTVASEDNFQAWEGQHIIPNH
jgi:hypothetical protein